MLHEDFDSQEYTMPSQSVRQNCNLVFLGKRNFIEDKNGSRPLDRRTGKVTTEFCIRSVLSSQGNTKQQTTLSLAFLSSSSDLDTNICRRGVPRSRNVFPWSSWEMHPWWGALRMSVSPQLQTSPWEPLCPSSHPSNMNFPTVQTWLTSSMFKRNPLSVLPYHSYTLAMCSPLGHNVQMTRNELCTTDTSIFPRCT